jgi:hypothetical protein
MKRLLRKAKNFISPTTPRDWENANLILAAQSLMHSVEWKKTDFSDPFWIQRKEFRVYSQFGDDGIIQWLVYALNLKKGRFIEFGVGDYYESNTHFLLINNRFQGFIIDGSQSNIDAVRSSSIYWRYHLNAIQAFVDRDNIQDLLKKSEFEKAELLHIDLDGNDYWILDAIDVPKLDPDILILEYNAVFGKDRAITVPYDPKFFRMSAHYSGKYFGASLLALADLARSKGYYFIGCNSAGNNAYFLASRYISVIPKTDVSHGYQEASYRESRSQQGQLTYFSSSQEASQIRGLPVIDTMTNQQALL